MNRVPAEFTALPLTKPQIQQRNHELGRFIWNDYFSGSDPSRSLTIVTVLCGAVMFSVDLVRCINGGNRDDDTRLFLEFVRARSYAGTGKGHRFDLYADVLDASAVEGRDVLLIDDIADSGETVFRVRAYLEALQPRSLKSCVLLDKAEARSEEFRTELNYVGFKIHKHFVVGYGLDQDGAFRHHRNIRSLSDARFSAKRSRFGGGVGGTT